MKLAPSLFVVVLGLLTGWLASTGAEAALAGPPRLEPASGPPPPDHADADGSPSPARLGALLGLPDRASTTEDETPAPEPPRLAGTLAPTFAAVVDERGRMQTLGVGALLGELELVAVEHFAVTWRHHGRILHANVRASSSTSDRSPPRLAPVTLSRHAIHESLARLPEIARGVQFVPDFSVPAGATGRGRVLRGYRLERLEPTSVLASAGLLRGDLLQRINGLDLSRPEHLGQLLVGAPEATRVEIDLERRGQAVRLVIELSP